jgi:hypothetical protein
MLAKQGAKERMTEFHNDLRVRALRQVDEALQLDGVLDERQASRGF